MKVKPYRICDICEKEYHKTHGCMRLKHIYNPMQYDEIPIMEKVDICPECSNLMVEWIKAQRKEV